MKEGLTFTASERLSNEPEKKRAGHKPMLRNYEKELVVIEATAEGIKKARETEDA